MNQPLTKSQQVLRGKNIKDFNEDQLKDWIEACKKMELWVKPAKARRSWKKALIEAEEELEKRENNNYSNQH